MRLFVALDLPDAVKRDLAAWKTPIAGATWVRPESFHLTLKFLGDQVAPERVPAIREALAGVRIAPFAFRLAGVGRFPPSEKKAARVLWVGVDAPPALAEGFAQVERAMIALGFAPESHAFHPHITLARLKTPKTTPEVAAFLRDHAAWSSPPIAVDRFTLYESTLTPQGAHYRRDAEFALA